MEKNAINNNAASATNGHRATILAVDDNPSNLSVICSHLKQHRYRVVVARDGESAIERAIYAKPDLILLDVLMPGIDGYETCEKLKENKELKTIPVIFMTALADVSDKMRAFQSGGVDYITKPFQPEEVLARVRTHLELQHQQRELEHINQQLILMQQKRDELVNMIVHDLRAPLCVINCNLELFAEIEHAISEDGKRMLNKMHTGTTSLVNMVSSILDVYKMESGAMTLGIREFDLEKTICSIFDKFAILKGGRTITLQPRNHSGPALLEADEDLIARVIENLLMNAIKFTDENEGCIRIALEERPETIRFIICDNGCGIPEDFRNSVFEKFGIRDTQPSNTKYSTGLGLPFCKLAIEAHGGDIQVGTSQENGAMFMFELPRKRRIEHGA